MLYYCIRTIIQGGDDMAWSFNSDKAVYLQIAERIKRMVLSGEYGAGSQIPTVRQLALEAAVNPNTVQHAFSELENEGIIISKGTLGRFVTENAEVIELSRRELAKSLAKEFLKSVNELSFSNADAIEILKEEAK